MRPLACVAFSHCPDNCFVRNKPDTIFTSIHISLWAKSRKRPGKQFCVTSQATLILHKINVRMTLLKATLLVVILKRGRMSSSSFCCIPFLSSDVHGNMSLLLHCPFVHYDYAFTFSKYPYTMFIHFHWMLSFPVFEWLTSSFKALSPPSKRPKSDAVLCLCYCHDEAGGKQTNFISWQKLQEAAKV